MSEGSISIFEKSGDGLPLQSGLTLGMHGVFSMKGMMSLRNCKGQMVPLRSKAKWT